MNREEKNQAQIDALLRKSGRLADEASETKSSRAISLDDFGEEAPEPPTKIADVRQLTDLIRIAFETQGKIDPPQAVWESLSVISTDGRVPLRDDETALELAQNLGPRDLRLSVAKRLALGAELAVGYPQTRRRIYKIVSELIAVHPVLLNDDVLPAALRDRWAWRDNAERNLSRLRTQLSRKHVTLNEAEETSLDIPKEARQNGLIAATLLLAFYDESDLSAFAAWSEEHVWKPSLNELTDKASKIGVLASAPPAALGLLSSINDQQLQDARAAADSAQSVRQFVEKELAEEREKHLVAEQTIAQLRLEISELHGQLADVEQALAAEVEKQKATSANQEGDYERLRTAMLRSIQTLNDRLTEGAGALRKEKLPIVQDRIEKAIAETDRITQDLKR